MGDQASPPTDFGSRSRVVPIQNLRILHKPAFKPKSFRSSPFLHYSTNSTLEYIIFYISFSLQLMSIKLSILLWA